MTEPELSFTSQQIKQQLDVIDSICLPYFRTLNSGLLVGWIWAVPMLRSHKSRSDFYSAHQISSPQAAMIEGIIETLDPVAVFKTCSMYKHHSAAQDKTGFMAFILHRAKIKKISMGDSFFLLEMVVEGGIEATNLWIELYGTELLLKFFGALVHRVISVGQRDVLTVLLRLRESQCEESITEKANQLILFHCSGLLGLLRMGYFLSELDVECVDAYGFTPLQYACIHGQTIKALMMLTYFRADRSVVTNTRQTILHLAMMSCDDSFHTSTDYERERCGLTQRQLQFPFWELINNILQHDTVSVNMIDDEGNTPLHSAACINLRFQIDYDQSEKPTPEQESLFEFFQELGANLDCQNMHGQTPLHVAAIVGNLPFYEALIRHGAKVDIEDGNHHVAMYYLAFRLYDVTLKERNHIRNRLPQLVYLPDFLSTHYDETLFVKQVQALEEL